MVKKIIKRISRILYLMKYPCTSDCGEVRYRFINPLGFGIPGIEVDTQSLVNSRSFKRDMVKFSRININK